MKDAVDIAKKQLEEDKRLNEQMSELVANLNVADLN